MYVKSLHTPLMILLLLSLNTSLLVGCSDDEKKTLNQQKTTDENQPDDEKLGHGTDKDVEENSAEPGALQGVWRVVKTDVDKTPVVRVSIIQDEGSIEGTGDFIAQAGLGENFQGLTGTLMKVTGQDAGFTFTFNPTNDSQEVYTVTASSKVDDNTFSGTFASKTNTFNFPVQIIKAPAN